jgi:Tol biopolymer transport system component
MIGTRLAHYEITSHLGSGGMGEVYQATDTRLGRSVAIKILPEVFTHDTDRLVRFEREARALASLNHPHIAAIYGLEESSGRSLLVMELVEGETLAERIARGPVATNEALGIAKQIGEALEAAHEKGIIHRDLKPANIKITPDGQVKVLDFGLAKAMDNTSGGSTSPNSPTISLAASNAGIILGTAAYMSPEQARGRPVDKRTDIWAFGCVLYEMLTGKPTFEGEDVGQTLAAVIMKEPDLRSVPPKVLPLIASCLEKDLKKRLRDVSDAWRLLREEPQIAKVQSRGGRLHLLPWTVAGVLAAVAIGAAVIGWRAAHPAPPPLKPLVRLNVDLGPDVALGAPNGADVVLSPDGTRLAYVSQSRLFTRRLDQAQATALSDPNVVTNPSFSQDGMWIAFYSQGKLKKVSVEGGTAITLCDASNPRGISWKEDGDIVANLSGPGGLSLIPGVGGQPTTLTELAPGEVTHRWPQVLPGGKAVLFTSHATITAFDAANIEVMTLADHHTKILQRGGTFGRYLSSGHLVYVNRGTLFAVPFDLDKLEVRGTPTPVLDQVGYSTADGFAQMDVSLTGTLVYRNGLAGSLLTFQWLDAQGKTQPLLAKPDSYQWPSLSPDGQRLALSMSDVWVYDWKRDTMTRLTFDGGNFPVWSPDGRTIAFRKIGEGIFLVRSDGAGKPQQVIQSKGLPAMMSFMPDGKRMAYQDTGTTGYDLLLVPIQNDSAAPAAAKPEVLLQTPFNERWPSFSPDGRWLAYGSDESGNYQIYVRAFPDKGGKWQVSSAGGAYPEWSRNGNELFYRADDNHIMVANYTVNGDTFTVDKPRVWSPTRVANSGINGRPFDLTPDGKRVAALMPLESPEAEQAQNHVMFVENFFDELQRRVPVGK